MPPGPCSLLRGVSWLHLRVAQLWLRNLYVVLAHQHIILFLLVPIWCLFGSWIIFSGGRNPPYSLLKSLILVTLRGPSLRVAGGQPACHWTQLRQVSPRAGPTGFMRNVVLHWSLTGHVIAGICWDDPPSGEWSSPWPMPRSSDIRFLLRSSSEMRAAGLKKTESWPTMPTLWRTNISCIPQRKKNHWQLSYKVCFSVQFQVTKQFPTSRQAEPSKLKGLGVMNHQALLVSWTSEPRGVTELNMGLGGSHLATA